MFIYLLLACYPSVLNSSAVLLHLPSKQGNVSFHSQNTQKEAKKTSRSWKQNYFHSYCVLNFPQLKKLRTQKQVSYAISGDLGESSEIMTYALHYQSNKLHLHWYI